MPLDRHERGGFLCQHCGKQIAVATSVPAQALYLNGVDISKLLRQRTRRALVKQHALYDA